ncbi:MAG: EamA family transporter [Alphaproteobacteria bacterium]|uniref:EamA family transporter n=1 Tax=Pyruvatibacter sp. HU-CL02332 TaxID=3127650 RepID=UPI002969448E|nr:EamA family transporter [Alphaproteobacteria bacterium]
MADTTIIIILLLTAILHATWNVALKTGTDRVLDMAAIRVSGVLFAAIVIPLTPMPAAASWPPLIASAIVYMAYYGFLISSYKHGDISQVYPIARGSAPLLVALAAFLFINETPGSIGLAGVIVVSIGIVIAGSGAFQQNMRAVAYALITGLTIAANSFLGGIGVRDAGTILGYSAWLELLTCVPFIAFACVRRRGFVAAYAANPVAKRNVLLGFGSVFSFLIALWAMTQLPIATVAATRETSAIFAALAGAVLMKEPFAGRRILAAILVAIGIALLVVG